MANKILILGESGTGKSTSLRNLNSEETCIVQVVKKALPFKGWKKLYSKENKNLTIMSKPKSIIAYLNAISEKCPKIKTVIVDDLQYCMSVEFMDRVFEEGWGKYNEIAKGVFDLMMVSDNLREDLTVVFLSHIDTQEQKEKMKTIGKMLDDKITPEGLFSIVLKTIVHNGEYFFETQNSGTNTIKSPMGMLEFREPNDLKEILNKITAYDE